MSETLQKRKKQIFEELYRFTSTQCTDCERTGCACKDTICQHVESVNAKRGFKVARTDHALRFIGCKGCVVPPHMRETCTIYLCEKAKLAPGFDHVRYKKLRRITEKIEWRLMQKE